MVFACVVDHVGSGLLATPLPHAAWRGFHQRGVHLASARRRIDDHFFHPATLNALAYCHGDIMRSSSPSSAATISCPSSLFSNESKTSRALRLMTDILAHVFHV
tara:strand:- start:293 stop:604 length:312 start_codon:yes stop_codon:yes gene_type:complete